MTDPRKLRPSELCRLLNSTPLGEVTTEAQIKRHRTSAGLRIGSGKHVDLVRYVAWLVRERHSPAKPINETTSVVFDVAEAAAGAVAVASRREQVRGHGQKFTRKQEEVIAAIVAEPTYAAAAKKANISEATIYRWLEKPEFQKMLHRTRRELVASAVGRIQASTGVAVQTLVTIAEKGRREGDRVRAANALLDHANRGLENAAMLQGESDNVKAAPMGTAEVVIQLATQLKQIEQSDMPIAEKSRLTATLADATLKAINIDVIDKRLEALQTVLIGRKDRAKK